MAYGSAAAWALLLIVRLVGLSLLLLLRVADEIGKKGVILLGGSAAARVVSSYNNGLNASFEIGKKGGGGSLG